MPHRIPETSPLPHALYRAEQLRLLDRAAIDEAGIAGGELMERAGRAAYRLLRTTWPRARSLTVLCGAGNNAGDGYVVARRAAADGLAVRVIALADPDGLRGDALAKAVAYRDAGGRILSDPALPARTDVIIDALLGIGIGRDVEGRWAEVIRASNAHQAPVLAIDVPSGLDADTGAVRGTAIEAQGTTTFIGLKPGLFTGAGPDCCGRIHFDRLDVPATVYARTVAAARRIDWPSQRHLLAPRRRTAHKGDSGHVLVIGGAPGLAGAARLAGEAALRAGAGLVTIATHPAHASWLNIGRPELMCRGVETPVDLAPLIERADVIALGPGLGQDAWGEALWRAALNAERPLVVDADALNRLARAPRRSDHWILTPHPGEAARLLGLSTAAVQLDRIAAARTLQERFGGVAILKGAGSVIVGPSHRPPAICSDGNPGLASGGTGDALTGVVAALLAQGLELEEAAEVGVCLHAAAGDAAAREGERGLLASDLIAALRGTLRSVEAR
ncbi:yjeF-like protein, hydroxyethylthiazole kinase-related protein [Thioflavicoccus mobilis 8321]|uniref:Bifunctional NAD(P)H-hydrate repair enzyme n=1 Tax=Thioflavicoccus mobilis 8321 TaxID=765912 RepID=L0GWY8_9GAMM|nr:bifunctional ADP-dependent NAD(P)H-hydrate dehydratase/NAD(P)H-hydrate epimerase [Thioflavicoccus mobilis]AGA90471.1 yjeF-like protein, hydroxyethylthiazole kinase-related protein [Thioflavicoccus mobilis 8321]